MSVYGIVVHLCASSPQEYITLLLSDDEMQNIIEYFDQFDINQGNYKFLVGLIMHFPIWWSKAG